MTTNETEQQNPWRLDSFLLMVAVGITAIAFKVGDQFNGFSLSTVARIGLIGWCILGPMLIIGHLLLGYRHARIKLGECIWIFEACWRAYGIFLVTFDARSNIGIFLAFVYSQLLVFLVSCVIFLMRFSSPSDDNDCNQWINHGGVAIGVTLPIVVVIVLARSKLEL